EVVRQRRRTRRRSESHETPLAERTPLGIVVGAGRALEAGIVFARGRIRRRRLVTRLHRALARLGGNRRHAAFGRIDHERRALFAVDDGVLRAGIDPEAVVAADVSGRADRAVAADRRGFAVRFERAILSGFARRRLFLELHGVLVGEKQRRARRAFVQRQLSWV